MNLVTRNALVTLLGTAGCLIVLAQAPVPVPTTPERREGPAKPEVGPATRPTKAEMDEAQQKASVPPAMVTAAPVDPKTYEIGPEDILFIKVWRENDFTGAVQVRPDGKFTLPLVGELQAAGLTPEKLAAEIAKALENYINKPEVSVSIQSVQSKKYYITGEVNRNGSFPLIVPTTVLEALTNAGGFKEYANTKKIIVMRGLQRFKFNYKDVIKGKNLEQNILIQNGDYIHVP